MDHSRPSDTSINTTPRRRSYRRVFEQPGMENRARDHSTSYDGFERESMENS